MRQFLFSLFITPTIFFSSSALAQTLTGARNLNLADSGVLTTGALDASGNLYVASTMNLKTLPGQNGMAGLFPAGDPVLSKFGPDGALLWRREFPGNFVRICDAAATPDQGLLITGGYVDTFRLAPDWLIPGVNDSDAAFFLARLDADGNFLWIKTDLSDLPEDRIGWTLAVALDAVYVAGIHDAVWASLRRYDFDGNLHAEKILDIRSISDLALDDEGRLYAVGTASPWSMFANLPVPIPPQTTGYANYVARLDSTLTAQWIRSSNYITFDEHPKVAVFDGHVFALSNDFDPGPNQFGCYRLKAYTSDGDLIWADSILPGFIPADYQHFALQSFCERLLLQFPSNDGIAVRVYDSDLNGNLLVQTAPGNFEGSFPFICTNEEQAVFGSNFRNAEIVVNDDFTLQNAKAPGYQQFILEFECTEEPTGVVAVPQGASEWRLAPNPAGSIVYLQRQADAVSRGVCVELFDATGSLHWRSEVYMERTAIPLETLPAGSYFLRVTEDGRAVTLKGTRQ